MVVFACLSTKAIKILPCPGYDTDCFVKVLKRFFYEHGRAAMVRSDIGMAIKAGEKLINPVVIEGIQGEFQKTEW